MLVRHLKHKGKKQFRSLLLVLALSFLLSIPPSLGAKGKEDNKAKWEVGLGLSFNTSIQGLTYQHIYSPIFKSTSREPNVSTSTQLLNVEPGNSLGLNLIINRLFNKKFGIQLLMNTRESDVSGSGNGYKLHLKYYDTLPPDYQQVEVTRDREYDLPDTEGSLNQSTFALNLLTRLYITPTVTFDLSGGPGIFLISGDISPISYDYYAFSHFMIANFPLHVKTSLKSKVKLGLNAGATLNIALNPIITLFISSRYFLCPKLSAKVTPEEVMTTYGEVSDLPLSEVVNLLNLEPMEFKISTLTLNIGLKFVF